VARRGRLALLEPFIHAKCHTGIMTVVESLSSRLGELEAAGSGSGMGALTVERALLLAQVWLNCTL